MVQFFLNKRNRKVMILQFQKLCGFLNFLCKCIIPGRAFLMRLYASIPAKLPQHYHIRITSENRMDLEIWNRFLQDPTVFYRSFMDFTPYNADDIDMYSDVSRSFLRGFGAYCGSRWTWAIWDYEFMKKAQPSIEYLELFGATVVVLKWIKLFKNRKITLFVDNKSVMHMINRLSSKCKNCMVLIRFIILEALTHNVHVTAKFVKSKDNGKADTLSRGQFRRFMDLGGKNMDMWPTEVPSEIWPIEKIWLF